MGSYRDSDSDYLHESSQESDGVRRSKHPEIVAMRASIAKRDDEIERLRAESENLALENAELMDRIEELYWEFLSMRGVEKDDVCGSCNGLGVKTYASTSTWRRGIGGQAITNDVCDSCWGSGRKSVTWANLRKLEDER